MKKIVIFLFSGVLFFSIGIYLERWIAGDYSKKLHLSETVLATSLNKQKQSELKENNLNSSTTLMAEANHELRNPLKIVSNPAMQNFRWRNLEPVVLVDEQTNHFLFQTGKIYLYPHKESLVYPKSEQFLHFMAISRQTVKSQGKLWYQVAFPDEVLGWICEDQIEMHNDDYYFYQTGGSQPNLAKVKDLNIEVSIGQKRVYVKSGENIVYTMLCQTARNGYFTPTGSYSVNDYRANSFWSTFGGADYAVGWKDGGLYLFHSIDKESDKGPYAKSQGLMLGVTGSGVSHGCIQLSIPDAKWFYEQLPTGTPVSILA